MEENIRGTTESGFEFCFPEKNLNYRLLKSLRHLDKGEGGRLVDAMEGLLGEEQADRLVDFVEEKFGSASTENVGKLFYEIFESIKELKN